MSEPTEKRKVTPLIGEIALPCRIVVRVSEADLKWLEEKGSEKHGYGGVVRALIRDARIREANAKRKEQK